MNENIPKILKRGTLEFGKIKIPCAVLDDNKRTRVLFEAGVTSAVLQSRSGASKRRKKSELEKGRAPLPIFMAPQNLKPFISDKLLDGLLNPIKCHEGEKIYSMFQAEMLPQICDVWLKAREGKALQKQQTTKAQNAEILLRAIAHVGIIALIDEATGYQEDRPRDELQQILKAYISEELLPWTTRFPMPFYKEMFRLWGWKFPPTNDKGAPRGPRYAGKLTKQLVYEQLPPGVIEELEKKNPPDDKWQRKHKHHQRLTEDIGNPHLEKQVAIVTTLMKISPNKRIFERHFARAFPSPISGPEKQEEFDFMKECEEE
jgi:hypothetical protein